MSRVPFVLYPKQPDLPFLTDRTRYSQNSCGRCDGDGMKSMVGQETGEGLPKGSERGPPSVNFNGINQIKLKHHNFNVKNPSTTYRPCVNCQAKCDRLVAPTHPYHDGSSAGQTPCTASAVGLIDTPRQLEDESLDCTCVRRPWPSVCAIVSITG